MRVLIKNIKNFGTYNLQGIHQILETEGGIENARYNAERDGFDRIIFYVTYHEGWMFNFDFRNLVHNALELKNEVF